MSVSYIPRLGESKNLPPPKGWDPGPPGPPPVSAHGFSVSIAGVRPVGTTAAEGYSVSSGKQVGTTAVEGYLGRPCMPVGTTAAEGYSGRPVGFQCSGHRYHSCIRFNQSVGRLTQQQNTKLTLELDSQLNPYYNPGF